MKKILITAAVAIAAIVEVGILIFGVTKDTEAPEIRIYQEEIQYSFGCSDGVILSGIVAHDAEDGDVSDTAEVVSRSVVVENRLETVAISACDKSGNVATTKVIFVVEADNTFKILDYSKYNVDMDNLQFSVDGAELSGEIEGFEVTTAPEETTIGNEETTTPSEEQSSEEPSSEEPSSEEPSSEEPSSEEPSSEEPSSEPPTVGPDGKPVIELKYNEVTVAAGASSTIYVNSIKEIYDDKDSRDYLFRRVGLTQEINLSVPGDYVQGLYCRDSEGNRSEIVELIVHVR